MKYLIVQGDGMADDPQEELNGLTPLEAANTPHLDHIAHRGRIGLVQTVPEDLPPGSAVGNMSLLGLDPQRYYTGRAPLEAKGMGIEIDQGDVAFRCNLLTLREEEEKVFMEDYSGGHIDDEKAADIIDLLNTEVASDQYAFFPGVSYRNILVWNGGASRIQLNQLETTPPHDITGLPVEDYLPRGEGARALRGLIQKANQAIRSEFPTSSANAIWLWGEGTRPKIPSLQGEFGLDGTMISAVDLMKGIGSYRGLLPLDLEGATGYIDTDTEAKVQAAVEKVTPGSLVFLHLEAPDEASHEGKLEMKLAAIELLDHQIVGPLLDHLGNDQDYRLLLATDHYTKLQTRTHERGLVPCAIYEAGKEKRRENVGFKEWEDTNVDFTLSSGYRLMDKFVGRRDNS